jgi:hypothetical protein
MHSRAMFHLETPGILAFIRSHDRFREARLGVFVFGKVSRFAGYQRDNVDGRSTQLKISNSGN